jgi:TrmH family RNA methyltransferase
MLSKEKLKKLSKLKTKKGRKEEGKFLVEGVRLCEEAAQSGWPIETAIHTIAFEEKPRGKKLLRKLRDLSLYLIPAKNHDLGKLSDTKTAQGIICVARTKRPSSREMWEKKTRLVVALDGIRDPGNVGTLIRTADAFGIDALILSKDTVELFNPKVIRSSMGAIFRLKVFDEVDLETTVLQLKKRKFKIVGTDVRKGTGLDAFNPLEKTCLLIGSEAEGLNARLLELSDQIVHIPIRDKVESLNVAVAGGILLYHVAKERTRHTGR